MNMNYITMMNDSWDGDNDSDIDHYNDQLASECYAVIQTIDTVFFFFCVAIVVLGVFGNSAGVIVLLWTRYRFANSLSVYLIAVFVCDLGFLLCLSLQLANIGRVGSISCEIAVYVVNVLSFISQWIMWAISAERFLAVCHPMRLRYQQFCTVKAAVNFILSITVAAMALEIWVFFIVETNVEGDCDLRASASVLFDVFNLIDSFISYAVPGLMIGFFTGSVFRALHRRESAFREIDPSALRTKHRSHTYETVVVISRDTSQRVHKRERQAAWMLMAIVLVDTLLNVQNYVLRLYTTFFKTDSNYCVTYRCVQVISYMLYYSQFAANVVYLIFCPNKLSSRKGSKPESASGPETVRKRSSESYYYRSRLSSSSPVVNTTLRDSAGANRTTSCTPMIEAADL